MRPRHDPLPRVPAGRVPMRRWPESDLVVRIRARFRRGGGRGPESGGEPCPVERNRPLDLSGGAAAALEFDS